MDQLGPAGGGSSQEGDSGKPLFLGHPASFPRRHGHGSRHGHGRRDPKHDPPKSSLPPPPPRANPSSPPPSPPRDVGGPSRALTEMIQNLISTLKSKCDQLRQSKLCFNLAKAKGRVPTKPIMFLVTSNHRTTYPTYSLVHNLKCLQIKLLLYSIITTTTGNL